MINMNNRWQDCTAVKRMGGSMRKVCISKRTVIFSLLWVGFVGLRSLWLDPAAAEIGRILPSEVTHENLYAFQEQTRRDLPVGTAKQDVEAFLTRLNIRHTYLPPDSGYLEYGNSFHAVLDDLGWYQGFAVKLYIWIHLDDTNLVREIRFRTSYF